MTAAEAERPPSWPTDDEPTVDEVLHVLSNERRRRFLRELDTEEPPSLSDVTETIAAAENDCEPDDLTGQQRKRVYVGLYQCHLPKLRRLGILAGQAEVSENHELEPGPHFDDVLIVLDALKDARADDEPDAGLVDRLLGGVFA